MVWDRLYTPVSNMVAFIAVCFIGLGAVLRVNRRPAVESVMQLVGAVGILLGSVMSLVAKLVLSGVVGMGPLSPDQRILGRTVWLTASLATSVGFVLFAWGYVRSAAEDLPANDAPG